MSKRNDLPVADVTETQHLEFAKTLRFVKASAATWHSASLSFVSACFVLMVSSAYDGKKKRSFDDVRDAIREELKETGIKQAQIYRYIGLARTLCTNVVKAHHMGGPINAVLIAKDAQEATAQVGNYIRQVLQAAKMPHTLDGLGAYLGVYARTGQGEAAESDKAKAKGGNRATIGKLAEDKTGAAVIAAAVESGVDRVSMLLKMIDGLTDLADCKTAQKVLTAKVRALGNPPARKPETETPAGDGVVVPMVKEAVA